jgi:hypothetical protein
MLRFVDGVLQIKYLLLDYCSYLLSYLLITAETSEDIR